MPEHPRNLLDVLRRTVERERFPPAERRDSRRQYPEHTRDSFPERHVSHSNLDYPSSSPRGAGYYDSNPPGSGAGYYSSGPPSRDNGIHYVEIRPRGAEYHQSNYPRSDTGINYVEIQPRSGFDSMPHFEYQHPQASPFRPGPPLERRPALTPLSRSSYDDDSSSSSSSSSDEIDFTEFREVERSSGRASGHGGHADSEIFENPTLRNFYERFRRPHRGGSDDFQTLPREFDYEPPRRTRHVGSRTVANLLAGLPQVQVSTLTEDEKSCPICTNKYDTPSEATSTDPSETESCVRLLCHHTIGQNCIKRWLEEGNTTCPICRTDVYAP